MPQPEAQQPLIQTLKRVAFHLKQAGIPFALAGSFAVYARGGGFVDHDVDFLIKEEDAERALDALVEVGFRAEVPPEGWLVKVYDEDRLVDLIYSPVNRAVTDATLAESDVLTVNACHMPVLSATELMIHKVLSFGPHYCDFSRAVPVARSLREQIDWARVEREVAHSPYAQAFLVLLDRLNVISLADVSAPPARRAKLKEVG
jgi:putative nucleotidyltransferase-like protein